MKLHTLNDLNAENPRVVVRLDLNLPLQNGRVSEMARLDAALPTIRELQQRGARIVIISHLGRPDGEVKNEYSLRPVHAALEQTLGQTVIFHDNCADDKAVELADALQPGQILLLENLRFHAGEEKNDAAFAAKLARLGDYFVNDGFSVAHRAHASTVGIAKILPSFAGRLMEKEIVALTAALEAPARPVVAVIGGAKMSSKLPIIKHLLDKVDHLIIGGAMANTFWLAQGWNIGASLAEPDMVETARHILARAASGQIFIPVDGNAAISLDSMPHVVTPEIIGVQDKIFDMGPVSRLAAEKLIAGAKTVLWNGPLGVFENPPFDHATIMLARAVAEQCRNSALTAVAGGGDTVAALNYAGAARDFSYISQAGGAFLEWLEGKSLPGVEVLRR